LKIGLTGGIACGKSTVAKIFIELGAPVIDADDIAHRLVERGRPALAAIQQEYGNEILNPNGSLNRDRLREIVFSDARQKQKLESILHPLVYKTIQLELEQLNSPYCIIVVPLLFETGMAHFVDRILVVDCSVEIQVERVGRRDNLSTERIQSIVNSQVSRAFRIANADDLIENSEMDDRLAERIKKLHNLYLSLSDCRD